MFPLNPYNPTAYQKIKKTSNVAATSPQKPPPILFGVTPETIKSRKTARDVYVSLKNLYEENKNKFNEEQRKELRSTARGLSRLLKENINDNTLDENSDQARFILTKYTQTKQSEEAKKPSPSPERDIDSNNEESYSPPSSPKMTDGYKPSSPPRQMSYKTPSNPFQMEPPTPQQDLTWLAPEESSSKVKRNKEYSRKEEDYNSADEMKKRGKKPTSEDKLAAYNRQVKRRRAFVKKEPAVQRELERIKEDTKNTRAYIDGDVKRRPRLYEDAQRKYLTTVLDSIFPKTKRQAKKRKR
jgi:hypothetical protein